MTGYTSKKTSNNTAVVGAFEYYARNPKFTYGKNPKFTSKSADYARFFSQWATAAAHGGYPKRLAEP
ncbi:hypothetical protein EB093_06705, partial [bacterium]|nr:hypothetical protein [bacterium]